MRILLAALLAVHGAIHLMGFAKGLGLAEIPELRGPIGPREGALWLVAAVLLLGAAAAVWAAPRLWWAAALAGVVLSQALIIGAWADARFGTIANVVLLVPIALAAADLRPSSLRSTYEREVRRALVAATAPAPVITTDDLAGLPPQFRTYLERVGVVGAARVRSFRATFDARIRGGPDEGWMAGVAEQHNVIDPPTRLFFMTVRRAGLPVHVFHRYADGGASMEGRLLGLFTIFEIGGERMTRSETVTVLNDAFFLAPAALIDLPVEWHALDDGRVRATWSNAGHTVSAVVEFDEHGDLVGFESEDRYQMDRDPPRLARWSTPLFEHRHIDGFRLPAHGEARWGDPAGEWAYGDFRLEAIEYNPAPGR